MIVKSCVQITYKMPKAIYAEPLATTLTIQVHRSSTLKSTTFIHDGHRRLMAQGIRGLAVE